MATTDQSIRSYLDSLGQLPGCILYRNTIAWEALPPGQDGQLLTIDAAGLPAWTDHGNYFPALMQYDDATTSFLNTSVPLSNSLWTALFRFATNPFTGLRDLWVNLANGAIFNRAYMSGNGNVTIRQHDSANNLCLQLITPPGFNDGALHYGYVTYNPSTGDTEFLIDGQNADDTGNPNRIATPATLPTDATGSFTVGRWPTLSRFWTGTIGAFGYKHNTAVNWQDFMDASGWPKPIDHNTWTQWVGQPPVWHESGALQWNRGSAGAFSPSGNLTLADPLDWN